MAAACSHRIPFRQHLQWFMLVWLILSWNAFLCFLVLLSPIMANLLLAATVSEFLPPHRFSQKSPSPDLSTWYQNHCRLTHHSLLLSLGKKNVSFFFIFSIFWCLLFCMFGFFCVYFAFFVLFLGLYHHSPVNCFPLFKVTLNYFLE